MTKFRPCVDLHGGQVKQIVGGTLTTDENQKSSDLCVNFTSSHSSAYYAELYRQHNLRGGHVIMLGPGNEQAAREALEAWPGGLQVGGGINAENAQQWMNSGAEKIIVTSYIFPDGQLSVQRLRDLVERLDSAHQLVIDLSCRKTGLQQWTVAMNKWQTLTDTAVTEETLSSLQEFCGEFLIHAADVEGLCQGIDQDLVKSLGTWSKLPCTYAGGGRCLQDLELVQRLSNGSVDLTIGSALDIFGGTGITLNECIKWNQQ